MNLSALDKDQILAIAVPETKVVSQIETFKKGIPFVNLAKAAVILDGITRFSDVEEKELISFFNSESKHKSLLKFVPASGAASRMFKALFNFLDVYNPKNESLENYIATNNDAAIAVFAKGLKDFSFYKSIKNSIGDNFSSKGEEVYTFVSELLQEDKLNYGFFPKGLLPFHSYPEPITPFQEHLKEAASYANQNGKARLHFTVSEQHLEMFKDEYNKVTSVVSETTNTSFEVEYSFQKSATNTIAVDMENNPFRNADGSLLFRPAGHGALIENLNEQDADVIFIKNIDNVTVSRHLDEVANSKKILAGHLLKTQEKAFEYAQLLNDENLSDNQLIQIALFLRNKLNVRLASDFDDLNLSEKINLLKDKINRPIRVCGMVKNEGEPGGGPFWVKNSDGEISLQIIESAQIDLNKDDQAEIVKNATHFNPVDLVCGVRNCKGEKYNLLDFVDHKQGFISQKTKEGKNLKALELPGLWNGAMAFWNTIFVEVPLITFNPVKTVNDLLKPAHQV